jgi:fermentation-respiration switch protein FrsA (DUF1100 family)
MRRKPLLVIHGSEDAVIPVAQGIALHAVARGGGELWVGPGIDHVGAMALGHGLGPRPVGQDVASARLERQGFVCRDIQDFRRALLPGTA